MEKENTRGRKQHQQLATIPRSQANSPRIQRSKSGRSLPDIHSTYSTTTEYNSGSNLVNRSKSTTKLRSSSYKIEENVSPLLIIKNKESEKSKDRDHHGFTKILQRNNTESTTNHNISTRSTSTSTSRSSAWALSPGRPLPNTVPKSPSSRKLKMESGGILKYFTKQKKISPALEEDFHQYRLMNNRLIQWRFVNARAEASMAAVKRVAQKKLFNVWLRISIMRNFTVEKRIEVQKLKHDIKINKIMNSQGNLLREWQRLEVKNCEAVGRVTRKLSAISLCLPLVDGAEANVMSVYDAMRSSEDVMDGIEDFVMNMQWQIEQSCYMLAQLIVILKQEREYLEELENHIKKVASLEAEEETLRVHCIQLANEWKRCEGA